MNAIENNDDTEVIKAVHELPAPMRDTLAYLMLHLQKVATHSNVNKMPIENLARVLAPTIIGHSRLHSRTLENASQLCRHQYNILLRLLRIPSVCYFVFVCYTFLISRFRTSGANLLTNPLSSQLELEHLDPVP